MKKTVDLLWAFVFSCFLLAFVGGNAYFLFAQQAECPNSGVCSGECTGCDVSYIASFPTPTCTVDAGCSGEGNKLSTANIATTSKKDKKAVLTGFLQTCLRVVKCEISLGSNGVPACIERTVKILKQAPTYQEENC